MLQTLFHIPREVAGLPMFGLGWLLSFWAIGSAVWLAWLVRREGLRSAMQNYLPMLITIGALIAFVMPALGDREGLPIRGYGVMLLLGMASGVGLAMRRAQRMGLNPEMIQALAFWVLVAGILGARAFYVIEYWHEYQRPSMLETVKAIADFTKGGLVVFGSALGAGLSLLLFVRKHGLPGLALADLIAPSVMLGLAFGRVGCFLNGCCFGGVCDEPWAVRFPPGSPPHMEEVRKGQLTLFGLKIFNDDPRAPAVINAVEPGSLAAEAGLRPGQRITHLVVNDYEFPGTPTSSGVSCGRQPSRAKRPLATLEDAQFALENAHHSGDQIAVYTTDNTVPATWTVKAPPRKTLPIHPAQLYAALDALILCLLLLAYYPYRRRDGEVFALMITIHPVSRFLQEIIRIDEASVFGTGMSISQNVSILMLIGAIGLWGYLWQRPKGSVWPTPLAASP
jgi:phosphatidylglycerol---prolipoprotein diacylglyceryl transferase